MKYIVILGDGMADYPLDELGGKTPLEYAHTPHMDRIAREGRSGELRTIPEGFEPGSDIANLSVLGYDPRDFYTGRGPLEAVSMGIPLSRSEMAYRCNLVTVVDGVMQDFSAGHISSSEGAQLLQSLGKVISKARVYPGISYRNLLVLENGRGSATTPPHDIVGSGIDPYLPKNGDAPALKACMEKSKEIFADHPVNAARRMAGKPAATMIWPWSGGKRPDLPSFSARYGHTGGMISAVDLLNGIARCAGMEVIRVPGATGFLDTNYHAKAEYAIDALNRLDFVYLHVEAPDEAGHMGSIEEKIRAIERLDEVCGTVMDAAPGVVAVLPDHPTPIAVRTHTRDPVPFAVYGKGKDDTPAYSEKDAKLGSFGCMDARDFLPMLFS